MQNKAKNVRGFKGQIEGFEGFREVLGRLDFLWICAPRAGEGCGDGGMAGILVDTLMCVQRYMKFFDHFGSPRCAAE